MGTPKHITRGKSKVTKTQQEIDFVPITFYRISRVDWQFEHGGLSTLILTDV